MFKNSRSIFKNKKYRLLIISCFIVIALVLFIIGIRIHASRALQQQTIVNELPRVSVIRAKQVKGIEMIVLPGNVQAWHQATIYARINGYIKKWYVDIGAYVQAGELLADIEAPELDAQLRQAQANLNTAIANNNLAQSTAKRWGNLLKSDSVSKQEADEKNSSAAALQAVVISAHANVDKLKELVSFERIIAPFAGIITSRTTDIGALINAGSSTTGIPLFKLAQTNPLRVYVNIPQNYSSRIKADMKVSLSFAEHPGQIFAAKLLETSHSIEPISRTLLAQFSVQNKKGLLLPGGYTEVTFKLPVLSQAVRLPVNTLLFRAEGLQVAILGKNNRIDLKSINISRDFGTEVEIESGIKPGEIIIVNPPDSLLNGEQVQVVS